MLSSADAQKISDLFYAIDTHVRNDLFHNRIADERDYVSRLITHIGYPCGIFGQPCCNHITFQSKWYAKVNHSCDEQKFGCDSMIVFKVANQIKVGLFEAKWPRVIKNPSYSWDKLQNNMSHFSNQILRQSNWTNSAAIWEMFFYEEKVGKFNPPFDKNASTCIQHQFAENYIPNIQSYWKNKDLINLIKLVQTGTNETNIKQIILDNLTCKFGKLITIKAGDNNFVLTSNDKKIEVPCPILFEDESNNPSIVEKFMSENGLSLFLQLDIESSGNK